MISKHLIQLFLAISIATFAACGDDGGGPDVGGPDGGGPDGGGPDATCFEGTPSAEIDILNACPTTGCIRFDNRARLPRLGPNGELPPVN